jgi:nucleotide-binding universal stress UspA family protein
MRVRLIGTGWQRDCPGRVERNLLRVLRVPFVLFVVIFLSDEGKRIFAREGMMLREFKQVLCGVDFSEASYDALDYALRFARAAHGTLIVAHMIHVPAGDLLGEESYTLNFDEARRHVAGLLEELRRTRLQGYRKCELLVDFGDPAGQLLDVARKRKVDLIVTATHGRSRLSHLIMGSVADKIIRHAPCPVFVVREDVE